jgi:hypothetical protein
MSCRIGGERRQSGCHVERDPQTQGPARIATAIVEPSRPQQGLAANSAYMADLDIRLLQMREKARVAARLAQLCPGAAAARFAK